MVGTLLHEKEWSAMKRNERPLEWSPNYILLFRVTEAMEFFRYVDFRGVQITKLHWVENLV